MTPEELRRGNLIEFEDNSHEIVKVDYVYRDQLSPEVKHLWFVKWDYTKDYDKTWDEGYSWIGEFVGVPLTKVWMRRLGFEQIKKDFWRLPPFSEDILFQRIEEGKYSFCRQIIHGADETKMHFFHLPFQYVHEIQNLFYALKRQELKIEKI